MSTMVVEDREGWSFVIPIARIVYVSAFFYVIFGSISVTVILESRARCMLEIYMFVEIWAR